MPFMLDTHNLLPTREVAKRLGVTPSAISRMVARGALVPALKAPGPRGVFMFAAADIEELANVKAADDAL